MSLDLKLTCAVCAWREKCVKKHTLRESAMHCPDYARDQSLPPGEDAKPASKGPEHKKIIDPFSS